MNEYNEHYMNYVYLLSFNQLLEKQEFDICTRRNLRLISTLTIL